MRSGAEPEVVREYRHLLRTASTDWQETAHRHALMTLGPAARTEVLAQVRRLLLTGYRIGADDVHAVARLIVLAERRRPRTLLDGLPPDLVLTLATAVTSSPTGRMLRAGIDLWDGAEPPEPPEEPAPTAHSEWTHAEFGTSLASPDEGVAGMVTRPPRRRP